MGIVILLIIQVILLVLYVNKTNRDLTRFLIAAARGDSLPVFDSQRKNTSYLKFHESLNEVRELISDARTESAMKNQLLHDVINHVEVGMVICNREGEVEMINRSASEIIGISSVTSLHEPKDKNKARIFSVLSQLKPGQPKLIKVTKPKETSPVPGQIQKILAKKLIIKSDEQEFNLISLQNISTELDRNELDSWQKLIRVLTHEIMNSISPVISLTKTLSGYFTSHNDMDQPRFTHNTAETIKKTLSGLDTIRDTGEGLLNFVRNYRSLTRLPQPVFYDIAAKSIFSQLKHLVDEIKDYRNITITYEINPLDLIILADSKQIEQVLINLIINSMEAIGESNQGTINLKAFQRDEKSYIQVIDDGPGIPDDILDNIFVPFFTTKETGSGIGLSLCRQIMLLHEGTLSVSTEPGIGTIITLEF
jgi:nitrogen fixation/metabolism regulation signal transduction histidine kinase